MNANSLTTSSSLNFGNKILMRKVGWRMIKWRVGVKKNQKLLITFFIYCYIFEKALKKVCVMCHMLIFVKIKIKYFKKNFRHTF